jgi:hypothetical protein
LLAILATAPTGSVSKDPVEPPDLKEAFADLVEAPPPPPRTVDKFLIALTKSLDPPPTDSEDPVAIALP